MSLRDRCVNFRANEETVQQIEDIKALFAPLMADRSSVLRWIVKTMWMLLFTDAKIADVFKEWQVIRGLNAASGVTQMKLDFPPPERVTFYPRFGGQHEH